MFVKFSSDGVKMDELLTVEELKKLLSQNTGRTRAKLRRGTSAKPRK